MRITTHMRPYPSNTRHNRRDRRRRGRRRPPNTTKPTNEQNHLQLNHPNNLTNERGTNTYNLQRIANYTASRIRRPRNEPIHRQSHTRPTTFFTTRRRRAIPFPLNTPNNGIATRRPTNHLHFYRHATRQINNINKRVHYHLLLSFYTNL